MTPRPAKYLYLSCALGAALAACSTNGGSEPTDGSVQTGMGGVSGTAGVTGGGGATVAGIGGGGGNRGLGGAPAGNVGGRTGAGGVAGGAGAPGTAGAAGMGDPTVLVGWAAANCTVGAVTTTTGGGSLAPTVVTTMSALNSAAAGTAAKVIQFSGNLSGSLTVGSNKTIIGTAGATITGHVEVDRSVNVILQNFTVVGLNCSDVPANGDCQDGADGVTVNNSSHHIWIDHLDVSDGSDGNLDVTNASDCITISWSKFHYSATRVAGYTGEVHHFSNLVGADDAATGDTGKLRITWHHNWWADHVVERQPRVRFGQNHIFNNLWTSTGNNYCVAAAVNSNVFTENNAFINVKDAIDTTNYSNAATIAFSMGNIYTGTAISANKGTGVFTPPYPYTADPAATVQAAVMAGAGPH
jgi:pectate lyase